MMEEAPDQHARAMVSGIRLVHGRKASDRHGLFIGEGWAAVSGDSCPCAVDAEPTDDWRIWPAYLWICRPDP